MKKRLVAGTIIVAGAAAAIYPTLIGGSVAPDGKYPSTVRIFSGGGSCTATLIGPRTLLSAAHCMGEGSTVRFAYKGSNVNSEACKHHSGYQSNQTKDFALCGLSEPLTGQWEEINTDHSLVKKGDKVTLSGYGCTQPGGGGGNDGKLREGSARVTRTPSRTNWDIVTTADSGALCFGDSGGPAFFQGKVIGVNSRGDIEKTSYLSAVHMADQNFIKAWADDKGYKVCGLHEVEGCSKKPDREDPEEESFDVDTILKMLQDLIDFIKGFLK